MNTLSSLLAGFFLRILLPVGVTLLAILLLRRLDRRWQKEARSLPVVNQAGKPCWEVKGCPPAGRKACPAATRLEIPCWQIFRTKDGVMKEDCLDCDVFRQAPAPVRIQSA